MQAPVVLKMNAIFFNYFLGNHDPKATHQDEKIYNLDECVKTLLSGVKKCEETKDYVKIVFEGNRDKPQITYLYRAKFRKNCNYEKLYSKFQINIFLMLYNKVLKYFII